MVCGCEGGFCFGIGVLEREREKGESVLDFREGEKEWGP